MTSGMVTVVRLRRCRQREDAQIVNAAGLVLCLQLEGDCDASLVNTTSSFKIEGRPILSLHKFCEQAGISDVTAWRWRKNGWLSTVNIAGRPYLTDSAIAEFLRRAQAG